MGGTQAVELLVRFRFQPTVNGTAAREDERMNAVAVKDGQLKIAIEWRSRNRLPRSVNPRRPFRHGRNPLSRSTEGKTGAMYMPPLRKKAVDLNQNSTGAMA
jgi:hypothetical protein